MLLHGTPIDFIVSLQAEIREIHDFFSPYEFGHPVVEFDHHAFAASASKISVEAEQLSLMLL